jgi:hypothetical protein
VKLYSPTIDQDGNPGSQPSPWRPEVDWPDAEAFDPAGEIAAAQREERVSSQEKSISEFEEAKQRARMKREQAELSGTLAPDAEVFRDLQLRPRIAEAHDFQPVVRIPLVEDLFFKNTLSWVAGESGTFKSFVTADLAFRYGSEEMDYHGRLMTHGRALLVIAEGAAGYAERKVAWEAEHQREVKNVSIYPAPLQLGDTLKEMPALRSYLEEEREAGRPFDLILFDTQAMCTVGVDENTSEMNLVINMLHRIREVNGACVMVVHHFGKSKSAGMRGSSMIYAAADTVCVLNRKEDDTVVFLSTAQADGGKQKDAITEKDFLEFKMKAHPVGENHFGKTVFSLVPVAADSPPPTSASEAVPIEVPSVTGKQMPYLLALSFFRHHGAGQTELAKRMNAEASDKITYPALVRSVMIALEDKRAVAIHQGKWKVTPLGSAAILREQSDRERLEGSWVDRTSRGRRKPAQNLDQTEVFSGVSEEAENLGSETSETF